MVLFMEVSRKLNLHLKDRTAFNDLCALERPLNAFFLKVDKADPLLDSNYLYVMNGETNMVFTSS